MADVKSDATIADLFPATNTVARFVLAMSMARNDLDTSLRDALTAANEDRQDFSYRVRLVTSHLVEALDSLSAYAEHADVRKLIQRVPTQRASDLSTARGTVQKVGSHALAGARNNTFHYPSPKSRFSPSSDEQLRDVISRMGGQRALLHLDHRTEHAVWTVGFASEVALALAMARHSADREEARAQFSNTSKGAVAFTHWADALLVAYFDFIGATLGDPEELEDDVARPSR